MLHLCYIHSPTYAISDLYNNNNNNNNKTNNTSTKLFIWGMKVQCVRRILLGDNTGGTAGALQLMRFQYVWVLILIHTHTHARARVCVVTFQKGCYSSSFVEVNWVYIQATVDTHTHTHTHIYIYVCVCVCPSTVACIYTQFDFHKAGTVLALLECNYCITLGVSVLVCADEAFLYLPCGCALQHQSFLLVQSLFNKYTWNSIFNCSPIINLLGLWKLLCSTNHTRV
jgi:hypothetical protein